MIMSTNTQANAAPGILQLKYAQSLAAILYYCNLLIFTILMTAMLFIYICNIIKLVSDPLSNEHGDCMASRVKRLTLYHGSIALSVVAREGEPW